VLLPLLSHAPGGQYTPAAHSPVGAVNPTPLQYRPPSHSVHSLLLLSAVEFPYVPAGHG
jgi:hypothetical protein